MGKVVVSQFVTLDGVMEDPGGSEGDQPGRLGLQVQPWTGGGQVQTG
jgi:hypothetical protein